MASALSLSSRAKFRIIFAGTCRLSGRLRSRAYLSDGAGDIERRAARKLAEEDLSCARYVTTVRNHGRGG